MVTSEAPNFGKITVDPNWKIAIIRSIWYDELTTKLASDAVEALVSAGVRREHIGIIDSPGSYELPILCKQALLSGADGCIAFGIIVNGSTHHAELVARGAEAGIMQTQLELMKPIAFEILYVDFLIDARERSIGKNPKGGLAANTLLTSLARLKELR